MANPNAPTSWPLPRPMTMPRPVPRTIIRVEYDDPADTGSNRYQTFSIEERLTVVEFKLQVHDQLGLPHDRIMLLHPQGPGGGAGGVGYDRREIGLKDTESMVHEMNRLGLKSVRVEERNEYADTSTSLMRVTQPLRTQQTQQAAAPPPSQPSYPPPNQTPFYPPPSAPRNPNNMATPASVPRGASGSGIATASPYSISGNTIGVEGESQRNIVIPENNNNNNQPGPNGARIENNRVEGGSQGNLICPSGTLLELAKLGLLGKI